MKQLINLIETETIDWDDTQVVDRIVKQYENFSKAFQKEAIQNSWDARLDKREGKNWKIEFYLHKENNYRNHLVIEDYGTTGMDDKKMYAFLSLWKPNKEYTDAGGQGQGKFVLMGGSNDQAIIVESIDCKNIYRCKFLQRGKKSKENNNLKINNLIPNAKPLFHQGTRVWIFNVRNEFLREIVTEDFKNFIIESWWQILGSRFNAKIILFGKKIELPTIPPPKEEEILLENEKIGTFGRIKRLVLRFYDIPIPEFFQGIMVQRANMMITKIPFEIYDKNFQGHFSGYVEFDNQLESFLKKIEKSDHYGFLYQTPWKELKEILKKEAFKFTNKIIPSKKDDKKINLIKNFTEIIQKVNQIINDYCPEIIGGGSFVPPIPRKQKELLQIKYLIINKKEVNYGDIIKPLCSIINKHDENKEILVRVEIKKGENKLDLKDYQKKHKLRIGPKESKTLRLPELELTEEQYSKGKYTIRVTIEENNHDIDSKATSFYLEIKREKIKRGFIKSIVPNTWTEPTRYRTLGKGVIQLNTAHKDFENIWKNFEKNKNLLIKQTEFYIMRICLDEAINELLKTKIKENINEDIDELIKEISDIRDKMYYSIYV